MKITIAKTDKEIFSCFPVISQLRPLSEEEFIKRAKTQSELYGYKLIYIEDAGEVVAVAGFRISHSLSFGKFLYVDDLITEETNRSKGYGDKLIDYLIKYAKKEGCAQFHLDSGVQRFEAHRFYIENRMNIIAHHFALNLI